jgi:two-component system, cell cycle sensor histidine kinase and response regulator CckA
VSPPSPSLEDRLESVAELAVQIAAGNAGARLPVAGSGDALEAVIVALNMLAEELQDERRNRRLAEGSLQDELTAYETAPALFCSLDAPSLCIESCNQTLAAAVGLPKSEIIGRSVLDLYSPEYRDSAESWLRKVPRGASSEGAEACLSHSGGRLIVSTGVSRITSASGRDRLRVVFRNVTTERRLESQLAQAQKLEAIGRLSGGVAHDFNNILSVVTGAAALLSDLLAAHSIESEDIALIQQAVARGASLTRDLLAFSRRRVHKPVSTDVRGVMLEAQRMVERLVGEDIVVTSELPGHPVPVLIDGSQLSQVLINLAINARDAMSGGGSLHMAVETVSDVADAELLESPPGTPDLPRSGYAIVRVTDTGGGMTAEVRAQAFEPFFTTKGVGKGSGLGLSVCYGIIRQAGGRIVLRSELGRGTTVEMVLPLTVTSEAAVRRVLSTPPSGGRETVLVVEDDPAVCAVTRRVLERAGYRVLTAQNGLEALMVAERVEGLLDIVVSDVTMPGMGGIELSRELRRLRPDLRVLYLSGYTENLAVLEGPQDAGSDFLGKPFTASALLGHVRRLLDSRVARAPG